MSSEAGIEASRTRIADRGAAGWAFLADGFVAPAHDLAEPAWTAGEVMARARERYAKTREDALLQELDVATLDRVLAALGGDPLREDWQSFRPLIGREEAWSDWLMYLLDAGDVALMRDLLLGLELPDEPWEVVRELETLVNPLDRKLGFFRTDLVVRFEGGPSVHLEVKLGDSGLAKTWDEADLLLRTYGGRWHHFLLLLPEQRAEFHAADANLGRCPHPAAGLVTPLYWDRVASVLRRALGRGNGTASWTALARAFTGTLEQMKLGRPVLPAHGSTERGVRTT